MKFVMAFIFLLVLPELIPISEQTIFSITFSDWYGYIHLLSLRAIAGITLFELIKHIPPKEVKQKSLLICLLIFVIMEAVTGSIDPFVEYNLYNILYLVSGSCIAALCLATNFKKYIFKSDQIKKNNVYLCFYRPVTIKMFLGSLIGLPLGGMCLYTEGTKYGYILKKKTFQAENIPIRAMQKRFVVVDTGILYNDVIKMKLRQLIGTKAGNRLNCVWTLKPVLDMLGKRFSPRWWELIPPTYSQKVL